MQFTYRISVLGGGEAWSEALLRPLVAAAGGLAAVSTSCVAWGGVSCHRLALGEETAEIIPGQADLVIGLGRKGAAACRRELGDGGQFLLLSEEDRDEAALLGYQTVLERSGWRGKTLPARPEGASPLYGLGGALEMLCAAGLFTVEEVADVAAGWEPEHAASCLESLECGLAAPPLHQCKRGVDYQ